MSKLKAENEILRRLLWLRHGCSPHSRNGFDGEMLCHACQLDFKRDSARKIDKRLDELNMEKDKEEVEEKEKDDD